jgi:hypothetical protein
MGVKECHPSGQQFQKSIRGNYTSIEEKMVGIGCLLLPVVMGNALPNGMVPGTHMQGHETREDRKRKNRWSVYSLLFGLPNLLGAIAVYLFLHR